MSKKLTYLTVVFLVSLFIYASFIKIDKVEQNQIISFEVTATSSVYEVMNTLSSTTPFTSKYYPSLGYFIENIDGIKNANGYYWTLYVNGKYSSLGVSSEKVKPGDIIEWKYEKL